VHVRHVKHRSFLHGRSPSEHYQARLVGWDLQQQRPSYGPFFGTTRVSQYQKKHSPTHHRDHCPIFISLPWSIASSLFKLRAWQFFLHNLFPCPLWSTSWSGAFHLIFHTFLHPISVFFRSTCPYHRSLFCCSINIISSIPSLGWDLMALLTKIRSYLYLQTFHKNTHQQRQRKGVSYWKQNLIVTKITRQWQNPQEIPAKHILNAKKHSKYVNRQWTQ